MSDNTIQPDQSEGRGKKISGMGPGRKITSMGLDAQVEGHKFHTNYQADAEAPNDETTVEADDSRDADEPEVEGHRFHNR